MNNNLPELNITTQSILHIALEQVCQVCQDVPKETQEYNLNEAKNYAKTTELLKAYLL